MGQIITFEDKVIQSDLIVGNVRSKNIISNFITGYIINDAGQIQENSVGKISEYIPIENFNNYTLSGIQNNADLFNKRIHLYNDNKTWINQVDYIAVSSAVQYQKTFNINNSNAKYIRLSVGNSDTNVQLEQGTQATNYSPFKSFIGIADSGANDNGNWIKFEDGTMICHHIIVGNQFNCNVQKSSGYFFAQGQYSSEMIENNKRWTFPQTFIENPIVNCNVQSSAFTMCSIGVLTNTLCSAGCCTPYPVTDITFTWHFIAIGRWK